MFFHIIFSVPKESIVQLYYECKYQVLSNNIDIDENAALELGLLSVYSDFSIPTNFISFVNSLNISSLIPSSIVISEN
jgi:hypothetical protein